MEKSGNEDDFQPSSGTVKHFQQSLRAVTSQKFSITSVCVLHQYMLCYLKNVKKKMKILFLCYAIASVHCIQTKKYKFQSTWN